MTLTERTASPGTARRDQLGLAAVVVDAEALARTVERFRAQRVVLPTFAQLADPATIPDAVWAAMGGVDPGAPDRRNLFRVHWHNAGSGGGRVDIPAHVVLPPCPDGTERLERDIRAGRSIQAVTR